MRDFVILKCPHCLYDNKMEFFPTPPTGTTYLLVQVPEALMDYIADGPYPCFSCDEWYAISKPVRSTIIPDMEEVMKEED